MHSQRASSLKEHNTCTAGKPLYPVPRHLLSSSKTLGQEHRGEGEGQFPGRSNSPVKTGSWQLASPALHMFHNFPPHVLPIFVIIYCWGAPRVGLGANFSGWVTATKMTSAQHSFLLKPGPFLFISPTQKCTQTPFHLFIHIAALSIPGNWCSWHSGLGHAGTGLWVTLQVVAAAASWIKLLLTSSLGGL